MEKDKIENDEMEEKKYSEKELNKHIAKEHQETAELMLKTWVKKSYADCIVPGHKIVEDCNLWGLSKLQKAIYDSANDSAKKKTKYIDSLGNYVIFVVVDKGKQYHRCATGAWRNCNLYKLVKAK